VPYVLRSLAHYLDREFHPDEATSPKVEAAYADVLADLGAHAAS
jgi:hypothetical protein